jgi:hypothetical protein
VVHIMYTSFGFIQGLECILGAHSVVHNVHELWIYSGFRMNLRSPFHGAYNVHKFWIY